MQKPLISIAISLSLVFLTALFCAKLKLRTEFTQTTWKFERLKFNASHPLLSSRVEIKY